MLGCEKVVTDIGRRLVTGESACRITCPKYSVVIVPHRTSGTANAGISNVTIPGSTSELVCLDTGKSAWESRKDERKQYCSLA